MSVVAQNIKQDVACPSIAEMPPLFLWGSLSSIGIIPGDTPDIIQTKMNAALNGLLERPVYDAQLREISPQLGRKPQ